MTPGWITLHELSRGYNPPGNEQWREVAVRVGAIFAVGEPVPSWVVGAIVYSAGDRVIEARESRAEVIALCTGAGVPA